MTTIFITRHPGARDWAQQEGVEVDRLVEQLELDAVRPGDIVIGTLPIHLAAQVCARGGRYWHLAMEIPPARRGTEFSAAEMRAFGARLEEYRVRRVEEPGSTGSQAGQR